MRDLHDSPNASAADTSTKTQVLNLDANVAGTLAYAPFFIGLISSILWVVTEPPSNKFVRFHAIQSLALTVVGIVVFSVIGVLGIVLGPVASFLSSLVSIAFLGACILCMVKAWNKEMYKLPVIGDFVEQKI